MEVGVSRLYPFGETSSRYQQWKGAYNEKVLIFPFGKMRLVYYLPDKRYDFILDRGLEVGGMYEFRHINGHIEVFLDGEFQFSADTVQEAYIELKAG